MPSDRALRIVAALFVLWGVVAAISIIVSVFRFDLSIDLNVLGLWIGPRLLRHEPRWRRWALIILWLDVLAAGLVALMLALATGGMFVFLPNWRQVHEAFPPWATLPMVVASVVLNGWQIRVLSRNDVREWFTRTERQAPAAVSGG